MSKDTIGDFLTIIRNGIMASKPHVTAPYSGMRHELASILQLEGFINGIQVKEEDNKKFITVDLRAIFMSSIDNLKAIIDDNPDFNLNILKERRAVQERHLQQV